MQFETFRSPTHTRVGAQQWLDLRKRVPETVAWHDNKNIAYAVEACLEIRVGFQVWWKTGPGEITGVLAIFGHGLEQVELEDATQSYVAAATGKLQRQCRAPGPGANNGNLLCGRCAYQCFSSPSASFSASCWRDCM